MNMNQSIFGLIVVVGSQVDFGDCFEGQSLDEDDNDVERENLMVMIIVGYKVLYYKFFKSLSSYFVQLIVLRKYGVILNKVESKYCRKIFESCLLCFVFGFFKLIFRVKLSLKLLKIQDVEIEKLGEMDDKVEEVFVF